MILLMFGVAAEGWFVIWYGGDEEGFTAPQLLSRKPKFVIMFIEW
jgi:hypothetical protein